MELRGLRITKISVKHRANNDSDKGNHLLLKMLKVVRSNNPFSKMCKQLYTSNVNYVPLHLLINMIFWNKKGNQLYVTFCLVSFSKS